MLKTKLWLVILRRNWKRILVNIYVNLLTLGLIGIITLSITIPRVNATRDLLRDEELESIVVIKNGGISNEYSFLDIINTFDSLSKTFSMEFDTDIGYAIAIPLLIHKPSFQPVLFIYLNDFLRDKFNCSPSGALGSPFFNNIDTINVTSIDAKKELLISLNGTVDLANQYPTAFSMLNYFSNIYTPLFMDAYPSNISVTFIEAYIIGSYTVGGIISTKLEINADTIAGIFFICSSAQYKNVASIEKLSELISEHRKAIASYLLQHQMSLSRVSYISPILDRIEKLYSELEDIIFYIETLSVPNLLLIFVLIFSAQALIIERLEKTLTAFWKRGLNSKFILLSCYFIDLALDLLGLLLIQSISIMVLISYNIYDLISDFFVTYAVLTILINLLKLWKYIRNYFKFYSRFSIKSRVSNMKKVFSIPLPVKIVVISLGVIIFIYQISRIYEPLVLGYPLLLGVGNKIYMYTSTVILLFCTVALFLPVKKTTMKHKKLLSLNTLIGRIFSNNFRKIKRQRIITISLFIILSFFTFLQTAINYSNYVEQQYGTTNDVYIDSFSTPFPYEKIANLSALDPNIKQIYPIILGQAKIYFNDKECSTSFAAINSTLYDDKNLGWNHFFGKEKRTISSLLSANKAIINLELAQELNLNVNDNISVLLEYYTGSTITTILFNELQITAIVDYLPIHNLDTRPAIVGSANNVLYLEIGDIFKYCKEHNLERSVSQIGIDFEDNITKAEKAATIKNVIAYLAASNPILVHNTLLFLNTSKESIPFNLLNLSDPISLFILFNLAFAFIFLIAFIHIQSVRAFDLSIYELTTLGRRGCSDRVVRRAFIIEFGKEVFSSIIIGVLVALFITNHYLYTEFYVLFLAYTRLLQLIVIEAVILTLFGVIVSFIFLLKVSKNIRTVVKITKREVKVCDETDRG